MQDEDRTIGDRPPSPEDDMRDLDWTMEMTLPLVPLGEPPPIQGPIYDFVVCSDIDPYRIKERHLQIPTSATFAAFKDMVADRFLTRWLTETHPKGKKHQPFLQGDDEIYPYAETEETPEGGDPYFEHLKQWNNALRPVDETVTDKREIGNEAWNEIEKEYYKGRKIGGEKTKKTGRTITQFHKALKREDVYDTPGAGWRRLMLDKETGEPELGCFGQEDWKFIDNEQDWKGLKAGLDSSPGLIVLMKHQSVEDRRVFIERRTKMEEAIRSAGGWIPATEDDLENFPVL